MATELVPGRLMPDEELFDLVGSFYREETEYQHEAERHPADRLARAGRYYEIKRGIAECDAIVKARWNAGIVVPLTSDGCTPLLVAQYLRQLRTAHLPPWFRIAAHEVETLENWVPGAADAPPE